MNLITLERLLNEQTYDEQMQILMILEDFVRSRIDNPGRVVTVEELMAIEQRLDGLSASQGLAILATLLGD